MFERCGAVLFAVLLAPSIAWAGAWTWPQGSGQIVTTVTASTSTSVFDDGGALTAIPRYDKLDADLLLEYGITNELTAILQSGLQNIDIAAPTSAERTGLDYTEFGGRYRIWQNNDWVLSGQALLEIPGTTDAANPAAVGYTDVQADFRALLGHNFTLGAMPAFIDLELAQHQRGDGAPNEFRADATLGVQVAPRWMVLAQSFNVISEGAGSPLFGSYDYFKLQLSAIYALTPSWSLQGGGFTTYAGTNSLQENGAIFGVWYRF